jgi:hypothetical protein
MNERSAFSQSLPLVPFPAYFSCLVHPGSGRDFGAFSSARKRLCHGVQGESLVPRFMRGSVSLSWGTGTKPSTSFHAW